MTKMMAIRKEYGEPFQEVVKGFAAMRYSKTATAQTLGFNLSYFRQLLTRFNLHDYFYPKGKEQNESCRAGNRPGCYNIHRWGPLTVNGITWYPGEPTHHYLRARMRG